MREKVALDPYKGKQIDPDALMELRPAEIFNLDGKGEARGSKVYNNQSWLRHLECTRCGTQTYFVLPAYRSEDISKLTGEKPVRGRLVLPCTDCGIVFESYENDNSLNRNESDEL